MKKLLFILLLTIPFVGFGQNVKFENELIKKGKMYYFNNSPFNGIRVYYWERDEFSEKGNSQMTIKDGLPNGLYQSWISNGRLEFMGDYINGLNRNGVWKTWYKNGQIKSIRIYQGLIGEIETVTTKGLISETCWDKNGIEIDCKEL